MKNLSKIFLLQLFIFLVLTAKAQYKIDLNIKGAANLNAQFAYYESDKQFVVQNAKFDKRGKLILQDDKTLQHGIYFIVVGQQYFDLLIRNEQNFSLKADTSNLVLSMDVKGSNENRIFFNYQKQVFKLKQKIKALEKQLKPLNAESDDAKKIKSDLETVKSELQQVPDEIHKQYPDSYISKLLKAMDSFDIETFDFADEEFLLTPFYYNKIRLFIKKNIEKHYSYINFETKKLLSQINHNQANYQYVTNYLLNFYNTFYKVGINRVFIFIADNYFLPNKAKWFNNEQLKQIKERRDFLAQSTPGKPAQDLTLESTSGEYFSLLQLDANTKFLYFWSSNCGHCTKATKILKEHYANLQKKGVKIFAVNVDTNKKQWLNKLDDLQVDWLNCYDPHNESDYRNKYYVYGSPLLYVIGKNNKIIDVRNGELEIENLVKEILKK